MLIPTPQENGCYHPSLLPRGPDLSLICCLGCPCRHPAGFPGHSWCGRHHCPPPPRCRDRSRDRKSTRLNSSHTVISYAVFCLKKKTSERIPTPTAPHRER